MNGERVHHDRVAGAGQAHMIANLQRTVIRPAGIEMEADRDHPPEQRIGCGHIELAFLL